MMDDTAADQLNINLLYGHIASDQYQSVYGDKCQVCGSKQQR